MSKYSKLTLLCIFAILLIGLVSAQSPTPSDAAATPSGSPSAAASGASSSPAASSSSPAGSSSSGTPTSTGGTSPSGSPGAAHRVEGAFTGAAVVAALVGFFLSSLFQITSIFNYSTVKVPVIYGCTVQ